MKDPGPATRDRRLATGLATGDWVRLVGADPSFRGVGKLVEGTYDDVTGALTAACVDLGAGERWIAARELVRVEPHEEARLCELARERGHLSPERPVTPRLLEALAAFRAGARPHVRTPGLLDLLWNLSTFADPSADPGSGAPQVSDLLLRASTLLAPPTRPPEADESLAPPPPLEVPLDPPRRRSPRIALRPLTVAPPLRLGPPPPPPLAAPERVLLAALEQLDRRALMRLAAQVGHPAPRRCRERDLAERGADLTTVLDELSVLQLADVHAELGLGDAFVHTVSDRRARVLALARHPAAPPPLVSALALQRLLAVLGEATRTSAARALGLEPGPAPALAARAAAAGATTDDVARTLTLAELRFAAARLGLDDASTQDEPALRGWFRALSEPPANSREDS